MLTKRQISMYIVAMYVRRLFLFLFGTLAMSSVAANNETPPAWRNCVDKAAAEEAMQAYTSNVIRCYWAGEDERVANLMPANLTFQFAVIGDSDVTNRVQKVLNEVVESMQPELRKSLEGYGLINPTLQWLVRSCRPGITNTLLYVNAIHQPAAFKESDFNGENLKAAAARLKPTNIPLPVTVKLEYVEQIAPLGKAEPGLDYSDVLPEETFLLPFGCAIVNRAPERKRKIRLSATTWPYQARGMEFEWRATSSFHMAPWYNDGYRDLRRGFADVPYEVGFCNPRLDIMVYAKFGKNLYGPPTAVSIYSSPLMRRKYSKASRKLDSITYIKHSPNVPYDISQIWIPHEWKEEFNLTPAGRILSFERTFPGGLRHDIFSATGDLVLSMSSSGYPLETQKVEYFISPKTGTLDYRPIGEATTYRLGTSPMRRSGE